MTSPRFENLDDFFDVDEFALEAIFDGGQPVPAMLDRDFYLEGEATVGIEGNSPRLVCKTADVPSVVHGSTVDVEGLIYTIRGIEPSGDGLTTFRLEEA